MGTDLAFDESVELWRACVESRLDELCPPSRGLNRPLIEAMRYSLLAPGKRLRPILALASASAIGERPLVALDAGCAIEMVHCFSLIHDDLPAIDNDDLRRGRPTLHKEFDEMTAILAGDALFALAFDVIAAQKATARATVKCIQILSQSVGQDGLVGGEFVDVLLEGKSARSEAVQFIHPRKTGALFAASCAIGATLGGGTKKQIVALKNFGERLGLAFQIADDVLNETSTAEQMGKPVGNDFDAGKQTYPAVFGIEKSIELARATVDLAIYALEKGEIESPQLYRLAEFAISRTH